jgi:hypothetical protein
VATALLFVPFAIRGNMPGHEIVGSMSWVIIGGLITSIVVTLFLLPALYLRFGEGEGQTAELDLRDLWEELPEGESRMTGHSGLVGAEPGPAKP